STPTPLKQEGPDARSMTSSPIMNMAHDTRRRVAGPFRHRTSELFEPLAAPLLPRSPLTSPRLAIPPGHLAVP
ncbi:MAG: hypothetical protein M3334_06965, partial [Actinomycetota bacterium]|nr:hypothetical protein [Actinomycetota bacterium]